MNIRPRIDWKLLSEAVMFYECFQYTSVEVPWRVDPAIIRVTHGDPINESDGLALIGSAEQGFIAIRDKLTPGKYMSVSPCFRTDVVDDLHQSDFMKIELYRTDECSDEALVGMIDDAFMMMERDIDCQIVETHEGFDIMAHAIELGSYGRRQHGDHVWLYGTGLALPRFSQALQLTKDFHLHNDV